MSPGIGRRKSAAKDDQLEADNPPQILNIPSFGCALVQSRAIKWCVDKRKPTEYAVKYVFLHVCPGSLSKKVAAALPVHAGGQLAGDLQQGI